MFQFLILSASNFVCKLIIINREHKYFSLIKVFNDIILYEDPKLTLIGISNFTYLIVPEVSFRQR